MNTFTAVLNGKVAGIRKSERDYTHAVVGQHKDGSVTAFSFHGNEQAARKKAAALQSDNARWGWNPDIAAWVVVPVAASK